MAAGKGSRTLLLKLVADTNAFQKGMNRGASITSKFSSFVSNAMNVAGIAIAGLAVKMGVDGVKAALEDAKAQRVLAKQLQNSTKASNKQIVAVEKYIDELQRATGVADDELRPALGRLVRSTGNVTKAQKILETALDVSRGTGKDLNTVIAALGRAYDGNITSLGRLGIGIDKTALKNMDFTDVMKALNKEFKGFSEQYADSTEGKLQRLNIAWGEAQEQIGVALLPALEEMVQWLTGPEGQEMITQFSEEFAEAASQLAKEMPKIADSMGKLVDKASDMDWDSFLNLGKWAAAFSVAKNFPGPPQIKFLAAIAVYLGAENMLTDTKFDVGIDDYRKAMGLNKPSQPYAGPGINPLPELPRVNITVNGAVDPAATTKAIVKALNQSRRYGNFGWTGRGTG